MSAIIFPFHLNLCISLSSSLSKALPFCFHEELSSFSEITKDSKTAEKMEEVYHDINNIDLWVGGLAEDHESGSELGETFRT